MDLQNSPLIDGTGFSLRPLGKFTLIPKVGPRRPFKIFWNTGVAEYVIQILR